MHLKLHFLRILYDGALKECNFKNSVLVDVMRYSFREMTELMGIFQRKGMFSKLRRTKIALKEVSEMEKRVQLAPWKNWNALSHLYSGIVFIVF